MEMRINIIIILMPRPKKQEKKVCNKHTFVLKPQSPNCYYQSAVSVKMCLNQTDMQRGAGKAVENCYQGPVFNQDRNLAMPSFVINSDKNKYLVNATKGRNENQNKYYQNDEKSQILIPKPNSRTYCNVCKEKYEDYRDHVLSLKHKEKVRANAFNRDILQIEHKYSRARKELQPKEKESTQFSNLIIIDDDGQDLGSPRKRVKPNPDHSHGPFFHSEHTHRPADQPWRNFQYFPPPPYCPNYYGNFQAMPHLNYYNAPATPPFSFNFNYNIHVLGHPLNYMPQHHAYSFPPPQAPTKPNFIVLQDDKE